MSIDYIRSPKIEPSSPNDSRFREIIEGKAPSKVAALLALHGLAAPAHRIGWEYETFSVSGEDMTETSISAFCALFDWISGIVIFRYPITNPLVPVEKSYIALLGSIGYAAELAFQRGIKVVEVQAGPIIIDQLRSAGYTPTPISGTSASVQMMAPGQPNFSLASSPQHQ